MDDLVANLKILVADDHFAARQMLINTLRANKASQIDTAVDGKLAREMILQAHAESAPYHIVFLDWEMPLITGIDVLQYFRGQKQFATTAFVMVTSTSIQENVMAAIKAGATAYMIKPVSEAAITRKFAEVITWLNKVAV